MPSLFQLHVKRWDRGCGSSLCEGRRIVLARGQLPCDVLFCGEAPGVSEDALGVPFIGPAGKVLDQIALRAMPATVRKAFCNLVGCLPIGDDGTKTAEPPDEAIRACSPRLVEFVALAQPRLIVCVGKHAEHWLTPGMRHSVPIDREIPRVAVLHPAAILRMSQVRGGAARQGLEIQRCVTQIRNAVERYLS